MEQEAEVVARGPKLTKEQEEKLVLRLHDQSMAHKQETLRQLDVRFYPVMQPKRLPKEAIAGSVTRQVDQEMARRQAAREEREEHIKPVTTTRKVSVGTLESGVERLYTESIERKKANMEESRRRYQHSGPLVVQKKGSEIIEYVKRLAVPKKREFTIEEVNKVYGLDTGADVAAAADAVGGDSGQNER